MMRKLGIAANTAYGTAATNPTYNRISDSTKARASTEIAAEDASVATIRNAHRAELSGAQNSISGDTAATLVQRIKNFSDGVSEKQSTMKELFQQLASGRFSPKNLRKQAEALRRQEDPEPRRVLLLLKEMTSQGVAERPEEETDSLAKYKQLAEEVAGGHFSPKNLRKQAEALRRQDDLEHRSASLVKRMIRRSIEAVAPPQ